jgi:predicted Zn-dependent protease with MMP-like domain
MPSQMTSDQFEEIVDQAIDEIPERFKQAIENLAIVVEDFPDPWTLNSVGVRSPYGLLGFYHGIPLTQRTHDYGNVTPDRISIYRKPILAQCQNDDEVRDMVHRVVRHEIAHYFGIDDDRLWEIGAY